MNIKRNLFVYIAILSLILTLLSCDYIGKKHFYNIQYNQSNNGYTALISMHYPTVGISGINQVDWGSDGNDPSEVERDIYDYIVDNKLSGNMQLYLTLFEKNQYGEWVATSKNINLGNINCDEVRRYVDYSYFKGNISNLIYDGWSNSISY